MDYDTYWNVCCRNASEAHVTKALSKLLKRGQLCDRGADSEIVLAAHRRLFSDQLVPVIERLETEDFPRAMRMIGFCTANHEATSALIGRTLEARAFGTSSPEDKRKFERLHDALHDWVRQWMPVTIRARNIQYQIYLGYELLLVYALTKSQAGHKSLVQLNFSVADFYESIVDWAGHSNKGKASTMTDVLENAQVEENVEEIRFLERVLNYLQDVPPAWAAVMSKIVNCQRGVGECEPSSDESERMGLLRTVERACDDPRVEAADRDAVCDQVRANIAWFADYAQAHPDALGKNRGRPPISVSLTDRTGFLTTARELKLYWSWGQDFADQVLRRAREQHVGEVSGLIVASVLLAPLAAPENHSSKLKFKLHHREVRRALEKTAEREAAIVGALWKVTVPSLEAMVGEPIF